MRFCVIVTLTLIPSEATQESEVVRDATSLQERGRYPEAEAQLREILNRIKRGHDTENRLATVLHNSGSVLQDLGRYPEAERYYRGSVRIQEQHPKGHDTRLVALAAPNLKERLTQANERREQRAFGEAEAMCRLLLEEVRVLGERNPSYAVALNCLGAVLYDQGRDAEVISVLEEALPILEASPAADYVQQLAACRFRLGACYRRLGRHREAETLLAAAAVVIEKRFGPHHPLVASVLFEQGVLLLETGRCVKSQAPLLRSFQIRQETLGKDNLFTGTALAGLGTAYICLGRYAEAESSLRRSVSIVEKRSGQPLATILLELGEVYYLMGSFVQAEAAWRRAATIIQGLPQTVHLRVVVLGRLGALAQFRRHFDEAEKLLNEAAMLAENSLGKWDVQLASIFQSLGDVYRSRRDDQRAEGAYQRSIVVIQSAQGPEHPSVAIVLIRLALLRQTQKRFDEARSLFEKALEIDRKTIGPKHPSYGQHLTYYAMLLRKMKRKDEAKEAEARARAIDLENHVNTFTGFTIDVRELANEKWR